MEEWTGWRGAHLITPESSSWDPGLGSRFLGGVGEGEGGRLGWQYISLAARLQVTGLKEGSRPHVGHVTSQKPIISTVLPLNIPCPGWNSCWQLAAANLMTPTHDICRTVQPCASVLDPTRGCSYPPYLALKIQPEQSEELC